VAVGIYSQYQKCDATLLTLRVASHCRLSGYSVEYLPLRSVEPVHPEWDRTAYRHGDLSYHSWIGRKLSHIFWTEAPSPEYLRASRAFGSKNILLVEWESLDKSSLPSYKLFDRLVCPSWATATLVADKLKLKNICYVPWDSGLAQVASPTPRDYGQVKLFWSLWGSQAERQSPEILDVFDKLLAAYPGVRLTVSYSVGSLARQIEDALGKLRTRYDGKVLLSKDKSLEQQLLTIPSHDLVVWPSLIESAGLLGLQSLSMGVPVFAFNYPLFHEFLKDGRNAILVPCELNYNRLGVPYIDPSAYRVFGLQLAEVVQKPVVLRRLRDNTISGLSDRREKFSRALDAVLGD
jgi:glycosyltransferase involved in cell wall biosynthesis